MILTKAEFEALVLAVRQLAGVYGEDTIGALMLTGASTVLSEAELLELAQKIDGT